MNIKKIRLWCQKLVESEVGGIFLDGHFCGGGEFRCELFLFGTWYAHRTIDDLPVSDASKNILLHPLFDTQAKPRWRRAALCVLNAFRSPNRFEFPYDEPCHLRKSALGNVGLCSSHGLFQWLHKRQQCLATNPWVQDQRGYRWKKRWRRWRRRWRRRYYAPHTTTTTTSTSTSTSTTTSCLCEAVVVVFAADPPAQLLDANETTFTFPLDIPECCCVEGFAGEVTINFLRPIPVVGDIVERCEDFGFQYTSPNNLTKSNDFCTFSVDGPKAFITSSLVQIPLAIGPGNWTMRFSYPSSQRGATITNLRMLFPLNECINPTWDCLSWIVTAFWWLCNSTSQVKTSR